jgi:hypothetical protein
MIISKLLELVVQGLRKLDRNILTDSVRKNSLNVNIKSPVIAGNLGAIYVEYNIR